MSVEPPSGRLPSSKKLLLVDGNSLLHRAYHAVPSLSSGGKIPTNAVYGFATMLHTLIEDFSPQYLIVCFDRREPTFRKKLLTSYQSHRPDTDNALVSQFAIARDFLDAAHIQYIDKAGYEADDLIGTLSKQAKVDDIHVLILTGDRDITQLVDSSTSLLMPKKGIRTHELVTPEKVKTMLGVNADEVVDLKALQGDSSDNYKGVPGIGPKTAIALIREYHTLTTIYDNLEKIENARIRELLGKHKSDAELCRKLATILRDVPIAMSIASATFTGYNDSLKDFFEKYGFRSLMPRFFSTRSSEVNNKPTEKKIKQVQDPLQQKLF